MQTIPKITKNNIFLTILAFILITLFLNQFINHCVFPVMLKRAVITANYNKVDREPRHLLFLYDNYFVF